MPDSRATYFSSIDHASATQGYLQSAMDTHNSTVPTTPTTAGCDHNFESAVPFNGRKRFAPEALAPGCSWLTTWFLGKKCSALLQAPISIPADVRCMFQWLSARRREMYTRSWKTTQHWSGHQCIVKFQEMCIPSECIRSTPKAAEQIRLARTTGARQTSTADNSLGSTFHLRSWYQFTRLTWEGEGGGPADRAPGAGALCSGGGGSLHSSSGRHKPSNGLSTQPSPRS